MELQTVAIIFGIVLTALGVVSGIVSLIFLFADRRARARKVEKKETVAERSLALQEMELVLQELSKMNRRLAEELEECLRAKAALQKCKDS